MKWWRRRARANHPAPPCAVRWWTPVTAGTFHTHYCGKTEHYSTPHVCAVCGAAR